MKECTKCGLSKSLRDFYTKGRGKLFGQCKACVLEDRRQRYLRDGDVLRARVRDWQERQNAKPIEERAPSRSQAQNRASHLKKYGLTPETYDEMFDAQGQACAICRGTDPGRFWTVDHDHVTGTVRGILCWHCNVALGHFRDDVASLVAAADYLLTSTLSVT